MKTVAIKKLPDYFDPFSKTMAPCPANLGVQVFVDQANVLGDREEGKDSFNNFDCDSMDGYTAVRLLAALERMGVISLEYDAEIAEEYANSINP